MDPKHFNSEAVRYSAMLINITAEDVRYEYLNESTKSYLRNSVLTVTYMSICITCTVWQLMAALELVTKARKFLHFAILFQTVLSFFVIACSILNPLSDVSCEFRFWISIVSITLGGCVIQSILLYKAYICYDRARWLLIIGSIINAGYLALTIIYGTLGKVPTYKDLLGNCVMENLEWPALLKLGIDIASNLFLTVAFVMVVHRHYRVFGNSLNKSLISSGIIFSVGVIASNIITAILISCRAMGGLSADLYSFDWVITSYLLIKQFTVKNKRGGDSFDVEEDDPEETNYKGSIASSESSLDMDSSAAAAAPNYPKQVHTKNVKILQNLNDIDLENTPSPTSQFSDGVNSTITKVNAGYDGGDSYAFSTDSKNRRPSAN